MKYAIIIVLLIPFVGVNAQELIIDISDAKVEEFIKFETDGQSTLCSSASNNKASVGNYHSVKFINDDVDQKDYEAICVYDKVDSSIVSIRYLWRTDYVNSLADAENINLQTIYKNISGEIRAQIEEKFGKAIDNSVEETYVGETDNGEVNIGKHAIFLWKSDEMIDVKLDVNISDLYEKGELSKYPAAFTMNFDIVDNSKTMKTLPEASLNKNQRKFFKSIKKNDLDNIEIYLSPYMLEKAKDKYASLVRNEIGDNVKLKMIDGTKDIRDYGFTTSISMRYTYKKPKNKDKNVIIIYDGVGRIMGLFETDALDNGIEN